MDRDQTGMDRDQILQALNARIVGYTTSKLRMTSADAEDLAQEVLVVLVQKYSHLEALEDLLPLAVTILHNKCRNLTRKSWRRKEEPIAEELWEYPGLSPENLSLSREQQRQLADAVRRLKPKCRQLLRFHLEGQKLKDIARSLGEPEGTVNARWSRCRKALAKELRKLQDLEGES